MKTLYFNCALRSDIILTLESATEGGHSSLDFIPGINFLGITARDYDALKKKGLEYLLFHSGKVRFNDAHIARKNERSLTIPLVWNKKIDTSRKGTPDSPGESVVVLSWEKAGPRGEKKVQIKERYFTSTGEYITPPVHIAQKSAYDKEKRRSRENGMFAYHALRRGENYIFSVEIFEDEKADTLAEVITTALSGRRSVGRSRSAQYGEVEISLLETAGETVEPFRSLPELWKNKYLVIYADSALSFVDQYSQPTLTPCFTELMMNTPGGENIRLKNPAENSLCLDFCRIRPRIYSPWNGARYTRDNDRVCLEKGSVLVYDTSRLDNFDPASFIEITREGLGFYRNEGMGKVIINPSFFDPRTLPSTGMETGEPLVPSPAISPVNEHSSDKQFLRWFEWSFSRKKEEEILLYDVVQFMTDHRHEKPWRRITASQWGQVRSITQSAGEDYKKAEDQLFDEDNGFFRQGVSQAEWKKCFPVLKKKTGAMPPGRALKFLILLSKEMARQLAGEKEENLDI